MAGRSGQTYFFFAPLFIPFFILGVPIVDMAFAFVRRTANRTGFSTPDKNHLHHRLLRLGHGHRRSVLILWAWTLLLSGFILFPLYISSVNAVIPFGALALGVILYTLFHPSLRREADPGTEAADPGPPGGGPGSGGPGGRGPRGPARPVRTGTAPTRPGPGRGPASPRHRPAYRLRWPVARPTGSRGSRRAAAGPPGANGKRSVSYVLPPRSGKCDDASRELQAGCHVGGHRAGRLLDWLLQPNHCVISGTTREAPHSQTP